MRWEDEQYIRVYTRDTVDDDMLCWQARCVWLLILKKCTRAGLIDLGQHGTRGLARSLGVPPDLVKIALNGDGLDFGLIDDGRVELHDDVLVVPNFIAAQEAKQSDVQRSWEFRARAKDHARANSLGIETERTKREDSETERTKREDSVTERTKREDSETECDAGVTVGNGASQPVTLSLAVPNQKSDAQRSREEPKT